MKKVLGIMGVMGCVLAGVVLAGDAQVRAPWSGNVGTTARLIAPAPGSWCTNLVQWGTASNAAVTLDSVITVASQRFYQVTATGTCATGSASTPTHTWGEETNGTATLRFVPNKVRSELRVTNIGTGLVFVAYGRAAVTNAGIVLRGAAADALVSEFGGDVWAISQGSGVNGVLVHEE